jgi:hypothetical protein
MLLPCCYDTRTDLAAYGSRVETSETMLNNDTEHSTGPEVHAYADHHSEKTLELSEDDIIARARTYPENQTPVTLIFSPRDVDNPRNWSKARKWYITFFVSTLNVLT